MQQLPQKKKPERKCIGCGIKQEKQLFIRVVRTPEGDVVLDTTGKRSGRGAYLCKNPVCLKKARKANRISQALSCQVSDEMYAKIEGELTLLCP